MSILLEALKQQQQLAITEKPAKSGKIYLLLAAGFFSAILLGAVITYLALQLLTEKGLPEAETVAVSITEPEKTVIAVQQDILTSLHTEAETAVVAEKALPEAVLPANDTPAVATPVTVPQETLAEIEVSAVLRQRFEQALQETEQSTVSSALRVHNAPARDIRQLDDHIQQQIPPLQFDAHVYASAPAQRWVKVNGKTLQEGQWVTADIRIREITPHYVLLEYRQQLFSVAALTDWVY